MKKSLFRLTDVLELCIAYSFCFSLNLMFDYEKTLELTSGILTSFFRNFLEYQTMIVILFAMIASMLLGFLYLQNGPSALCSAAHLVRHYPFPSAFSFSINCTTPKLPLSPSSRPRTDISLASISFCPTMTM